MATIRSLCQDAPVPTILIVDDHPSFRSTSRVLLKAEGFGVLGEAGAGAATSRPAQVVTFDEVASRVSTLVLGLLVGLSFIASELVARARSPDNPTGRLMVAFGFVWFLGALIESNQSIVFTLGAALSSLFAAVFV